MDVRSAKKRDYSGLDSVFGRLQVTPSNEKRGIAEKSTSNGVIAATTSTNGLSGEKSLEIEIGRKLKEKRRRRQKSIIRKAKLILPKECTTKERITNSDTNKNDRDLTDLQNYIGVIKDNAAANVRISPVCAPVRCGAQYFQQNITSRSTQEDSSPDELASYFEQILHIPKPMSLMAQMMYA